jgi:PLP dependent protein
MDIKNNIAALQSIAAKNSARLVAVTKTHAPDTLLIAYEAGQRLMGENKVQEMVEKHEILPKDIEWHMIGHLQSNKVKYIAPFVSLIHSVDSLNLLAEINKQAKKNNRTIPCLLQVHIADEETKFGFDNLEIMSLVEGPALAGFNHVNICGLMGMASLTNSAEKIRMEFRGLKNLFVQLSHFTLPANTEMRELSMGMSSDYQIAL